ncbi:hypothetical protein [Deinococcus aquaticus]|uniref:Uncharacterized protein n=1 Tax=Deinococcus aquaticus TaxID=328692 RepID=A0ABY7UZT0_9DEIO|nr:hypothetical protein [Deinococcus aquaticus]WDA58412.1 hypothetical protein M8445_13850 [Deinococcus aquaticus]
MLAALSEEAAQVTFTFAQAAYEPAAHECGGWCTMSLMLFKENTFGAA